MLEPDTMSSNKYTHDVSRSFCICLQCWKCSNLKSLKTVILVLVAFTASYALLITLPIQVYMSGNGMLPETGIETHVFDKWSPEEIARGAASKLRPGMSTVWYFETRKWCRNRTYKAALKELCDLYHGGVVTGSLCPSLCDTHHIQVVKCLSIGNRKQVLQVSCNDSCVAGSTVEAFLKTSVLNLSETVSQMPDMPADDHLSATTQLVLNSLETSMPFMPFPRQEVVNAMWGGLGLQQDNATLRSLILLLGQAEYVLSKALGQLRIFPQIYGSCGHFYLQESCPALDNAKLVQTPWRERATAALGMLEELRKMEAEMPDPIIVCDMKISNFGTCADGDLRLLDVGDVFFNASMSTARGQKRRCRNHNDCRHVSGITGCPGQCDTDSGTCYMPVNENLESLCRRVFMTHVSLSRSDRDASDRLLKYPPLNVTSDLDQVLLECENLHYTLTYVPGMGQGVRERLVTVLKRSLEL